MKTFNYLYEMIAFMPGNFVIDFVLLKKMICPDRVDFVLKHFSIEMSIIKHALVV